MRNDGIAYCDVPLNYTYGPVDSETGHHLNGWDEQ